MFNKAEKFNQPLSQWDVSRITSMLSTFKDAKTFNQDLSNWTVKAIVSGMFNGSGLSKDNYCKIQASASWTKKPTMSQYTCE